MRLLRKQSDLSTRIAAGHSLIPQRTGYRFAQIIALALVVLINSNPLPLAAQADDSGSQTQVPTTVRFAVVSDYGTGTPDEAAVADMISSWNPDIVITAGDNRYGAISYDESVGQFYCDFLKDVESGSECAGGNAATNAFFPTPGNHDYNDGDGINEYLNYFQLPGSGVTSTNSSGNERYYDFVVGPVHFFALDSEQERTNESESSAQKEWLQTALSASTSPWQVVYFHHAPYSSDMVHGSSAFMQWPFEAWGADAVMSGHSHTYERLLIGGIPYFIDGVGGAPRYAIGTPLPESMAQYDDNFGAMLVTASELGIQYEFYSIADRATTEDSLGCVALNPTMDTFLKENEPWVNKGSEKKLKIRTKPNKQQRALLTFDTSSFRSDIVIESATLSLWAASVEEDPLEIEAHAVLASWVEQEVTWNDRDEASLLAWGTPGGDFDPDAAATATVSDAFTWITWDMTSLVPAWSDSSAHGVLLNGVQDEVKRESAFISTDNADPSLHPKLQICHSVPKSNLCGFDRALWCNMQYIPIVSR